MVVEVEQMVSNYYLDRRKDEEESKEHTDGNESAQHPSNEAPK